MLTAEENELLTRVGPGTPGGELFRRYWQPVAILPELTDAAPTKFVRILGEDLVLFRDKSSRVGLVADHCPHRGASLLYGRVEERGIACAYHGWLYDVDGNCLETPAEPADSLLHLTVKHRAYPVREHYGLYWAYLGPPPTPVLPRYDVAEVGPVTAVKLLPQLDCNWLQNVEQNLDQAHIYILHQATGQRGTTGSSTARGLIDDLARLEYSEAPFGIRRRQAHTSGYDDTDLMIFPGTQRIFNLLYVRVPIDDTHTRAYTLLADVVPEKRGQIRWSTSQTRFGSQQLVAQPAAGSSDDMEGQHASTGNIEYYVESSAEAKSPPDALHPVAQFRMDQLRFQDFTMLETQGPIAARENEHLATSDRGVVLLRSMLKREIEKVQQGLDPIGVIRDPDHDPIDTSIQTYIEMVRRFPPTNREGDGSESAPQTARPGPSLSR